MAGSSGSTAEGVSPFLHGYNYHCHKCSMGGEYYNAKSYCVECREYLCRDCYKVHRIPKPSRHHTLLDRDKVKWVYPQAKDILRDDCPTHEGMLLQYYCTSHDTLACCNCLTLAHKKCSDVQSLTNLSEHILESEEFKGLSTKLDTLNTNCTEILSLSDANLTKRKTNDKAILLHIQQFRKEINAELDRLENKIKSRLVDLNFSETKKLKSVTSMTTEVLNMVKKIQDKNERLQTNSQHSQLYGFMRKMLTLIPYLEEKVKAVNIQNCTPMLQFQACKQIKASIQNFESFGELCPEATEISGKHINDILVRTPDDKKDCSITGALTIGNKLIVADHSNAKVKVLNVLNKQITAQICLISPPWAITMVHNSLFIVTLPEAGELMFLQLWNDKLSSTGALNVGGPCYGIAHKNSRLFVTFINPGRVKILDLHGNVLSVFEKDEMGHRLFNRPENVCVSDFSLPVRVYVADSANLTLICLTQEGNVLAMYEDDNINGPSKMITDASGISHGTVYMCGCNYNNLYLIAAKCDRVKLLLYQQSDLHFPIILHYQETKQTLFLQDKFSNTIKLYRIKNDT